MIFRLLEIEKIDAMLVFARTKNYHGNCGKITGMGYYAEPLNGDMPQSLRKKQLTIKKGKINILVATDVAARGLMWIEFLMF